MSHNSECLFCSISKDRVILENEITYAIYDNCPVTPKHSLIIPKRHIADYFELSKQELLASDLLLRQLHKQIVENDNTVEGFNIGMNIGQVAGRSATFTHDALTVLNQSSNEIGRYSVEVSSTVRWGSDSFF